MTSAIPESNIPERPALEGLEAKWGTAWERQGTHRFDRPAALAAGKDAVFSVDTPPPTASGSLHIGHVFSYTHMDLAARYQRMRGKHLFYPMGWDDNGLPTERRVQNYYGVRCDPTLPYVPGYVPPLEGGEGSSGKVADQQPISRRNFIELCEKLTAEDEVQFENLWRDLGLSVDWSLTYRTIGARGAARRPARVRAQPRPRRGLPGRRPDALGRDLPHGGRPGRARRPDQPGAFHRITFHRPDGGVIEVDTTRPELIPADVALVAHPDDERYKSLFGTTVTTPLFGAEIPFLAHHLAQPDKGTGVAMVSTWGDVTDVVWWRELDLPGPRGHGHRRSPARGARRPRLLHGCGTRRLRGARRQDRVQRAPAHRRAAARVRRPDRRPEADHAPGQVLRARRQAARDRLDPPVVHLQRRTRRRRCASELLEAGRANRLPPRLHARALRELGRRPLRRLADLASALLRRADPGLVPARRRRQRAARVAHHPDRGPAAGRPVVASGPRLRRGPARRARRLRRRARHHGHLGHLEPHPADRRRLGDRPRAVRPGLPVLAAQPGPGHHPHLAVRDRAARRARARPAAVGERRHLRLHRRPRPQEDVEVEGQRRHPGRNARGARFGCGALLGGVEPARNGRGLRPAEPEADQDRPPTGDQGAERGEVRVFLPTSGGRSPGFATLPRSRSRSTSTCSPSSPGWSRPRPRRTTSTTTPARSR